MFIVFLCHSFHDDNVSFRLIDFQYTCVWFILIDFSNFKAYRCAEWKRNDCTFVLNSVEQWFVVCAPSWTIIFRFVQVNVTTVWPVLSICNATMRHDVSHEVCYPWIKPLWWNGCSISSATIWIFTCATAFYHPNGLFLQRLSIGCDRLFPFCVVCDRLMCFFQKFLCVIVSRKPYLAIAIIFNQGFPIRFSPDLVFSIVRLPRGFVQRFSYSVNLSRIW